MVPIESLSKMFKAIADDMPLLSLEEYSTSDLQEFLNYIKTHDAKDVVFRLRSGRLFPIIIPIPSVLEMESLVKLERALEKEINNRKTK